MLAGLHAGCPPPKDPKPIGGRSVAAPSAAFYAGRAALKAAPPFRSRAQSLPVAHAFGGPHSAAVKVQEGSWEERRLGGGDVRTRKSRANPCGNFATTEIYFRLRDATAVGRSCAGPEVWYIWGHHQFHPVWPERDPRKHHRSSRLIQAIRPSRRTMIPPKEAKCSTRPSPFNSFELTRRFTTNSNANERCSPRWIAWPGS
jgi:hypothetical protein